MQFNQGLAVVGQNELARLLKQFQDSQSILVKDSHKQITWTRRWAIAAALIFFVMVVALAIVCYQYLSRQSSVQIAQTKQVNTEAAQALEVRLNHHQALYRRDLAEMRRENQRAGQNFADYIAEIEHQQQSMAREYEKKMLALEKEKLFLENSRQELRKSCTRAELSLIESSHEMKSLKKQIAGLKKNLADYKQQVEHWKNIAAEKFSPEQWMTLQQDLKKDD